MINNHMIREQVDRNLTLCPSGRPEIEDSHVFGIVTGIAEQLQMNNLKKTISCEPLSC
ncbi:hypothetical protein Lepto7375DRAFT_0657 [Leptolyngbya sp. PCC 7375]|nr:hypothetical protein Lepto7375DRAFT_0657 [Leptolyngbya sp. PCC 7375]